MNTRPRSTRDRILLAAYALFYREGFSRVSVDAIAAASNVTKRTVYYHFKSKDDIVGDVLENQHAYLMEQFQRWAGPASDGPAALLDNLFNKLQKWAEAPQWLGSGFTRISTELADLPGHPARRAANAHKTRVEKWLAEQFENASLDAPQDRAREIMILIEGSMSLSLIHADTYYIESAAMAAKRLVNQGK